MIYDAVNSKNIPQFIDNTIGFRHVRAKYSTSDVVLSLFGNSLCQGDYIFDLKQLNAKYNSQAFFNIPSADTIGYACQELKKTTIVETTTKGIVHELNFNNDLSNFLVALCVMTNQLDAKVRNYIVVFNNVVIVSEKQDVRMSCKKIKGFQPNFAVIRRLPVHIKNHNGNISANMIKVVLKKDVFII
ncbi:hypothetical protein [Flavobacterium laiguense]|uniref:Uncharacterized protein n=1 Tax=Flavobacterium laiguense TaxID=2169409 RepID=A0A2U1JZL3_9FLAO|nr:hypothetical protein [Flavobacterium laiguense]PWA10213.1 hypothetical protein DB891_05820 [Flavobacterium laiguense]